MTEQIGKKAKIISCAVTAAAFVLSVVSFFVLPDRISVQLIGSGYPETNTLAFLLVGFLSVALCGAMCIFNENGKKWIAMQSVLAIAYCGYLIVNMIVL